MSDAFQKALAAKHEKTRAAMFKNIGTPRDIPTVPKGEPVDVSAIYALASVKPAAPDKPVNGVTYAITGNGGNNVAARKSWAQSAVANTAAGLPLIARDNPVKEVQVNSTRNRLDVYFHQKPTDECRSLLKADNWMFSGERLCWFHADTEDNRRFLRDNFGVKLDPKDQGPVIPDTIAPLKPVRLSPAGGGYLQDTPAQVTVPETTSTDDMGPGFERYRKQVDELIAELRIAPADLMLLAINVLHKRTFSRDS